VGKKQRPLPLPAAIRKALQAGRQKSSNREKVAPTFERKSPYIQIQEGQ